MIKGNNSAIASYLSALPAERYNAFCTLRNTILQNLPDGFEECIQYGMISYVVPHSLYPKGYHCKPETPLPFLSIANQKNFIAVYHMGIYADPKLLDWFATAYPNHSKQKLDIGKSCIRFKKIDAIPFQLIGELCKKMTPNDWILSYEHILNK